MEPKTIAYTFILAFFAIVFIQSGIDKVLDKKGNLSFLLSHLGKAFSRQLILLAFYSVTVLELISGYFLQLELFKFSLLRIIFLAKLAL